MQLNIANSAGPEANDRASTDARDDLRAPPSVAHGGDRRGLAARAGVAIDEILDFSASINPLGPPEWLRREISRNLADLAFYPEPRSATFRTALAQTWNIPADCIVAGNGLNELIYALPRLSQVERVVVPAPAYVDYARAAAAANRPVISPVIPHPASTRDDPQLDDLLRAGDLVFLGHPTNPTGELCDPAIVRRLARNHPRVMFAIDEAFLDFVDFVDLVKGDEAPVHPASLIPFVTEFENLIVLRSFTKFYAIPGLRLGCAVAAPALANTLARGIPDWSVNGLAQAIGPRLLADQMYAGATRALGAENRRQIINFIKETPVLAESLTVNSGSANFMLLSLRDHLSCNAAAFAERLLREFRIAVRVCDNFEGLGGTGTRYVRIAVRTRSENQKILNAMVAILDDHALAGSQSYTPEMLKDRTENSVRSKAGLRPAVMLQGTSSNAGKSVMTAAFCRIFLQDGLKVAPFKAQNMSLNSFVTADGREIARAQAVQAAACRLAPDIRMSPVLLKPGSDTGSQVLVRGRPVGHMSAVEYQSYKAQAFEVVRESYDSLCAEYDVIVLEGAGSPGEINLKQNDIVNMRMAQYAEAAVLLVGDIDRGGVFAGFVGTLEVLAEWERRLVIGYLVNRFRGDARLLKDAYTYMEEHTGLPILGVVPYLRDHGLPEEDSVTFREDLQTKGGGERAGPATLEILLIDLPYVSNFTDLDALRIEPDVRVRVLPVGASVAAIGTPDAIILPGTKNSLADLDYLKRQGLADQLVRLADQTNGPVIVGICGGYQMLGRVIRDPDRIESNRDSGEGVAGLGLLPVTTEFAADKTLRQTRLRHAVSDREVFGYEVHHGQTVNQGGVPFFADDAAGQGGVTRADGRVWGTYLHGVFDADPFRRWFIDGLRVRRGLAPLNSVQATYDLEPAFERVAAAVRENVDLGAIYKAMGL